MAIRKNQSAPRQSAAFHLEFVGRLGGDPDYREVGKDSTPVCNFSVAVDVPPTQPFGQTLTMWFRVAVWDAAAKPTAEALRKGDLVQVVARAVRASAFKGKDGKPLASLEVTAETVEKLR